MRRPDPRRLVAFLLAAPLGVALLVAFASFAAAQEGLFIRPTCASPSPFPTPIIGKSWCFDSTARTVKVWNGSAFVAVTGAPGPPGPSGAGFILTTMTIGGSAAANTAALVSDVSAAAGRTLYIPGGGGTCYQINAAIPITAGLEILGDGAGAASTPGGGTCIDQTALGADHFSYNATDQFGVRSLALIKSGTATGGAGIVLNSPGIVSGLSGAQNARIENVTFLGLWNGLHASAALFTVARDNLFWECVHECIHWENTQDVDQGDTLITGNTLGGPTTAAGVVWKSGGGFRFTDNKCLGFSSCLVFDPVWSIAGAGTVDVLIRGNSIENFSLIGIQFARSSGSKLLANVQILGNQIGGLTSAPANSAITFGVNDAIYVTNVTIADNLISDVDRGLLIGGGTRYQVHDNQFLRITTGGLGIGIQITGAAAGVQLGPNRCTAVTTCVSGSPDRLDIPGQVSMTGLQMLSAGTSNAAALIAPGGLAASYTLFAPTSLPGSTLCMTLSSLGQIGTTACGGGGGGGPAGADGEVQFNTAGAFNADSSLAWNNGTKQFTVAGTAILNAPAGTTTPALYVNQAGPTTGSQGQFSFNSINIGADAADVGAPGAYVIGFRVNLETGGANSVGSRAATFSYLNVATATTSPNIGDYISAVNWAQANVNMGGTDTGAGARGTLFAHNPLATLLSGATNWFSVAGAEVDVGISTGASAKHRFGYSYVGVGNVLGAMTDAALEIGSSGQPWATGLLLSTLHGGAALTTTGTVIGANAAGTIANIIALPDHAVTGDILRSPLARMTGPGHLTLGASTDLAALDVVGNANATHVLRGRNSHAGSAAAVALHLGNNADSGLFQLQVNSNTNTALGGPNAVTFLSDAGNFSWYTNGASERLRLADAGAEHRLVLSMNATAAAAIPLLGTLQVVAASGTQTGIVSENFGVQGAFIVRRANGTPGARTTLLSGDSFGSIQGVGAYDATNYSSGQASFGMFAAENWTSTAQGTFSTLGVTRPGTTTLIEASRFSGVKGVGLLTTAPTLSGSRNSLGTVSIPPLSFGSGGPTESTFVTGLGIIDTDTTVYTGCTDPNSGGANPSCLNSGAGSATLNLQKNMGAAFGGIGIGLNIATHDTRTDTSSTVEHDQVNIWSTMVNASGHAVNAINSYLIGVRTNTFSSIIGQQIEMVNFAASDTLSRGLSIKAGEEANRSSAEGVLGDAVYIRSMNVRSPGSPLCGVPGITCLSSTTAGFTNAINLVGLDQITSLFKVRNDGSIFMNLASTSNNFVEFQVAGSSKFLIDPTGVVAASLDSSPAAGAVGFVCIDINNKFYRKATACN